MFATPAFAQAAPAAGNAAAAGGMAGLIAFVPYLFIFVIFYVLLIRPQQQRVKAHRAMVEAVAKGDEVVTAGGLVGKVTRVMDAEAEVEIATGVKVRVIKATLAEVRGKGMPAPANDGAR